MKKCIYLLDHRHKKSSGYSVKIIAPLLAPSEADPPQVWHKSDALASGFCQKIQGLFLNLTMVLPGTVDVINDVSNKRKDQDVLPYVNEGKYLNFTIYTTITKCNIFCRIVDIKTLVFTDRAFNGKLSTSIDRRTTKRIYVTNYNTPSSNINFYEYNGCFNTTNGMRWWWWQRWSYWTTWSWIYDQ